MNTDPVNERNDNSPSEHIPVLLDILAERITLPTDGTVVDATVGHGGHSMMFGKVLGPEGLILGMDTDEECIKRAQTILDSLPCRVILVRENFRRIAEVAARQGVAKADLILADIGFCSAQLADRRLGLSFQENQPLDMRLDDRLEITAADIVNTFDEKSLADIIYNYGQDRASRRIARFIVRARTERRIETTSQLVAVVCKALGQPGRSRKSRIHPATRTFQALRIAVNDELEALRELLAAGPTLLKRGGMIAVISFHSLEDRIVKTDFRENAASGIYDILTKKPIIASRDEIDRNPRARSAKLRMARCKTD